MEGKGNSIADAEKMKLDPEAMKAPLAKFFIRSSHNTYLPGAQVALRQVPGLKTSNMATEERCVARHFLCDVDLLFALMRTNFFFLSTYSI